MSKEICPLCKKHPVVKLCEACVYDTEFYFEHTKEIKSLEEKVYRIKPDTLEDSYGGYCAGETWKEAFEESKDYAKWCKEEMDSAAKLIKAHPEWKYGENAYPSSHERAIIAGCTRAVKELQQEKKTLEDEIAKLKQGISQEKFDIGRAFDKLQFKNKALMELLERANPYMYPGHAETVIEAAEKEKWQADYKEIKDELS